MTPSEINSRRRKINYALHEGIDLIKLGITLDEMVSLGLPKEHAEQLDKMAASLLKLLVIENDRIHKGTK